MTTATNIEKKNKFTLILCLLYSASCENWQIRLAEGQADLSGRIEVCFHKRWGTVADDFWNDLAARVACRELGFSESGIFH